MTTDVEDVTKRIPRPRRTRATLVLRLNFEATWPTPHAVDWSPADAALAAALRTLREYPGVDDDTVDGTGSYPHVEVVD